MANSKYQRRHYEDTAGTLALLWIAAGTNPHAQAIVHLALRETINLYMQDNPRFDVHRFRQAVGPWAL